LNSKYIDFDTSKSKYTLKSSGKTFLQHSKTEYEHQKQICINIVSKHIEEQTGTNTAVTSVKIEQVVEQYLASIFSEIRIIANYFRESHRVFDAANTSIKKFDYVIKKHLPGIEPTPFRRWREGFLTGLQEAASAENQYISCIFHNILITYYLNRSTVATGYQLKKLQERELYCDTNILYSKLCKGSQFFEKVNFFTEKLKDISISLKVFPFTVTEYESHIAEIERRYNNNQLDKYLHLANPWLFQEFRQNMHNYLNNISICKSRHSIAKDNEVIMDNFDMIDSNLSLHNFTLNREFNEFNKDVIDEVWNKIKYKTAQKAPDMFGYWERIEEMSSIPDHVINHDCNCILNITENPKCNSTDELGPHLMFITTDSKLLKARNLYHFIISIDQFLEFMMPYLFMADIPLLEPDRFPNKILTAYLGSLLVKSKPKAAELIELFLKDKNFKNKAPSELINEAADIAKEMSKERYRNAIIKHDATDEAETKEIAKSVAHAILEEEMNQTESYFAVKAMKEEVTNLQEEIETQRKELDKLTTKVAKQTKTIRYLKKSKRGKKN